MEASYVDLADPTYLRFGYLRRVRDVLDAGWPATSPLHVAHVGGGGMTLPRYLAATRPRACSEVFESEPRVLAVARRHLGWSGSPRVRVHTGDARALLRERAAGSVDVVVGDAFVDGLVPGHLGTAEYAAEVARVLAYGGGYLLNVVDAAPLAAARRTAATLRTAFAEVALLLPRPLPSRGVGNLLFVASPAPLPLEVVRRRAARDEEPVALLADARLRALTGRARPFTDAEADRR